jgi:8-oxo-dGTP pyrophosphatase MutT (NUDIX family)
VAEMDLVRRALAREPRRVIVDDAHRIAAVALVLVGDPPRIVLMKRSIQERDPWSGHLSLPGGRKHEGDANPEAAAIRETHEELGLDLREAEPLGGLDEVSTRAPLPSMRVVPAAFWLPALPPLVLDPREVDAVDTVALSDLLAGRGRGTFQCPPLAPKITLPCVDLPLGRLWGMTLGFIDDLLDRLDGKGKGPGRPVWS